MAGDVSGAKKKLGSYARNHDENRSCICAICYSESGQKASRNVTLFQENVIKEHISQNYSILDKCYPSGLCNKCYNKLNKIKNGQPVTNLSVSEYFGSPVPPELRNQQCQCVICTIARFNGLEWKQFVAKCKSKDDNSVYKLCQNCLSKVIMNIFI